MKLRLAENFANRLLERFAPDGGWPETSTWVGYVAGSVRRQKPEPRDIELLLPCPPAGERDEIFEKIREHCIMPREAAAGTALPCGASDCRWFTVVKGLKAGFKLATLACDPTAAWPQWAAEHPNSAAPFKIDVFRYDPGPQGNFGLQMLIRTGPGGEDGFGAECLRHWKTMRGGSPDLKGSDGGYLLDRDGNRLPTPTEESAFELLGLQWIEPWDRHGKAQIIPVKPTPWKEIAAQTPQGASANA